MGSEGVGIGEGVAPEAEWEYIEIGGFPGKVLKRQPDFTELWVEREGEQWAWSASVGASVRNRVTIGNGESSTPRAAMQAADEFYGDWLQGVAVANVALVAAVNEANGVGG